jgi:hypothetical protein
MAPWERGFDELTPEEIAELQPRDIATPPGADLAVLEQRRPMQVPRCGDLDCSVCAARVRRYW